MTRALETLKCVSQRVQVRIGEYCELITGLTEVFNRSRNR